MRISAKARYALATMTYMANYYPDIQKFNMVELSERIGISKIYLEQVFAQLKSGGIVTATKGPKGGYFLSRDPTKITAYDILAATETSLFEPTPETVAQQASEIETAMAGQVFAPLDAVVRDLLTSVTLARLAETARENSIVGYMYYL